MILVLGKARNRRAANVGCSGAESPGWFDVSQKTSAQDMMHELARCRDEAANHQLPIAAASESSKYFWGGMFKDTKSDADSLLYSLSYFECDGHTVHMLAQLHLLPTPLTSTAKSSLFTHAHSSPLSLAARLHRCHVNHSHYINNGWTFSRQTSYMYIYNGILFCHTKEQNLVIMAM